MFVIMNERVGGPAFPDVSDCVALDEKRKVVHLTTTQHGMSLQDWFAGRALSYLPMVIAKSIRQTSGEDPVTTRKWDNSEQMAQLAYDLADAMIAERNKRAQQEQDSLKDEIEIGLSGEGIGQ